MAGTTVHYLSAILLLLAAMTPARSDCVSYYKPVQDQTVYSVVPTIPVDHATIQAMCSTKYPGFSLLASTEITPEMAVHCSGEIPLRLTNFGYFAAWNMPPGIPVKPLTPGELATLDDVDGVDIKDGVFSVMNTTTGHWRLVDPTYTFTCAICERSPKLDLHDPDFSSRSNVSFTITCLAAVNETALVQSAVTSLTSMYQGQATCRDVVDDEEGFTLGRCALGTTTVVQDGERYYYDLDSKSCLVEEVKEGPTCPTSTTDEMGSVLINWAETVVGSVRVARNVATSQLMTRECFADAASPAWGNVTYWEEVWQPCQTLHSATEDPATVQASLIHTIMEQKKLHLPYVILPIPVQQLEQFLEPVNEYIEATNKLNNSVDYTVTCLKWTVQQVMSTSLLNPGNTTSIHELSSLLYAVVDFQDAFSGILATPSWVLDIGGKSPVRYVQTGLTRTRIALGLPLELTGNTTRLSFVAVNAYAGGSGDDGGVNNTNSILLRLYFSDVVSNEPIEHASSLKIGVVSFEIPNITECVFFKFWGDNSTKSVCNMIEDAYWMYIFECKNYSPNGFYVLRQALPSAAPVPMPTPIVPVDSVNTLPPNSVPVSPQIAQETTSDSETTMQTTLVPNTSQVTTENSENSPTTMPATLIPNTSQETTETAENTETTMPTTIIPNTPPVTTGIIADSETITPPTTILSTTETAGTTETGTAGTTDTAGTTETGTAGTTDTAGTTIETTGGDAAATTGIPGGTGVTTNAPNSTAYTNRPGQKPTHEKIHSNETSEQFGSSPTNEGSFDATTAGIVIGAVLIVVVSLIAYNVVSNVRKGKCRSCSLRRIKERVFGKYKPEEGFVVHEVLEHDDPEGSRVTIHRGRSSQMN